MKKIRFITQTTSDNRTIIKLLTEDGEEFFDYVRTGIFRNIKSEIKNCKHRLTKRVKGKVEVDHNLTTKDARDNMLLLSQNKSLNLEVDLLNKEIQEQNKEIDTIDSKNIILYENVTKLEDSVKSLEIKNTILYDLNLDLDEMVSKTIDTNNLMKDKYTNYQKIINNIKEENTRIYKKFRTDITNLFIKYN